MAVNLEMSIGYEPPNYQNVERPKKTSSSPDNNAQYRGAFRLAGVCVGLMCIIQATLNIVLRLFFTSPVAVELLPTSCGNYTAEVQTRYNKLVEEKKQLESNYNNLRNVRDQLQAERDKLRNKLSSIAEEIKKPGWISFGSNLYYMSTVEKDWFQSRDECRKKGADLVIIKSREEQDFVEMLRRGKSAWIGLNDRVTEGEWKWVDGTPLSTNFWWSQEPNDYVQNEDCALTGYNPDNGRPVIDILNTWNDDSCQRTSFWICMKKIYL